MFILDVTNLMWIKALFEFLLLGRFGGFIFIMGDLNHAPNSDVLNMHEHPKSL